MSTHQEVYSSEAEWGPSAATYRTDVGTTSAPAASRLVSMASELAPIEESSKVLDVGAGAGAVTVEVLEKTKAHVTASDIHQSMLDSIVAPPGSQPNLILQTADARQLTRAFEKNSFSHVFCTFMLQTIRNPLDALREMHQMLQPSVGVIGIACWSQADPFDIFEKACQTIEPSYRLPPPFDDSYAWRNEEEVAAALRQAGFKDVRTVHHRSPFAFDDPEKFVNFWFGRKNPTAERTVTTWKGNIEDVKNAVIEICKEQYDNGRAITTSAALAVGRV